jgi:hypothetical protein
MLCMKTSGLRRLTTVGRFAIAVRNPMMLEKHRMPCLLLLTRFLRYFFRASAEWRDCWG